MFSSSTEARRYLVHWLHESGLADLLPSLPHTVWVGACAGSMVLTPRIGSEFVGWQPDGTDQTLGLVEFSIFPHVDYPGWSSNTTESARRWAAKIGVPAYAIDDRSALAVEGEEVRVVSEGRWERFACGAPEC